MSRLADSDYPVKAVATSFEIINTIKKQNGARLTEIADALDMPKSTVGDHLMTLHRNNYLVKDGNEYCVGLRFLELGDHARNYRNIYNIGKGKIDKLADDIGELVHLSVEENGRGVIIYETEGEDAVSLDTYIGRRVPMHCTALGKVMLANMPEERVVEIVDQFELPALTEQTITSRDELFDHLVTVRKQGYAMSHGERISKLGSVAAPIKNSETDVIFGAVSVCVPTTRMENERLGTEIPQVIRQVANRIELDLMYP